MQLNLIEKKALLGIAATLGIMALGVLVIGKRNLWFESKNHFHAYYQDVDGLSEGSLVTLNGLRVGEVEGLDVAPDNRIRVAFSVKTSVAHKIRQDSVARQYRAFVIGEKRIDIIPGQENSTPVVENGEIKGMDSVELPDLVSGKNIGQFTQRFENVLTALNKWSDALVKVSDKVNPEDLAKIYTEVHPLMINANQLLKDLKDFTDVVKIAKKDMVGNGLLTETLRNTNKILSPVAKREQLLESTLNNINTLMNELAKEPTFAKDILSMLKEVNITLKAIQKTWILKGHVEDVKTKP